MIMFNVNVVYTLNSIDLTQKSGSVIVMVAFAVHFIKEVSRSQLQSASRNLLSAEERKRLQSLEKIEFYIPLAKAMVERGIVKVRQGANIKSLSRSDVEKMKPF